MRRCDSAFLAHSEVSASSDWRKSAAEVDGYGRIQRSEIGSYHFPIFIYDTPCLFAARPTWTRLTVNQSRLATLAMRANLRVPTNIQKMTGLLDRADIIASNLRERAT